MAAKKGWKNMGMLKVWPIVGGVGNGAAEEDWHWDLSPGVAAILERPPDFGRVGTPWL